MIDAADLPEGWDTDLPRFDPGDDPVNLLKRLDARRDKRRERQIFGLLVSANSPETGENRRRRRLPLRWSDECAN